MMADRVHLWTITGGGGGGGGTSCKWLSARNEQTMAYDIPIERQPYPYDRR